MRINDGAWLCHKPIVRSLPFNLRVVGIRNVDKNVTAYGGSRVSVRGKISVAFFGPDPLPAMLLMHIIDAT
jgi:hypothetical protein